ncbi:MAG TPA: glycosyltransferase family 2 protein [Pseudolabrys sp.]|nr:glycosyltransferase family 2 protein [Pseudolabrys sp.]
MELILSWAWLATAAWLIFRAFNQRGLLQPLAVTPPTALASRSRVAVIVPARDEAENIGPCLQSLLNQDFPASRLSVLVVDDHSGDDTAVLAARVAEKHAHVTVLRSPPLPARWIGKSHACWIAARAAAAGVDWLCFVDADVRATPALLSSAVADAESEGLDLLSVAPRQELKSFAERLVIPCGLFVLGFCQDLRKVQATGGNDATATGQFMLVRARVYEEIGGHAAICAAICEDLELARLIKRSGGNVVLRADNGLLSTRMYTGWRTLWPGFAKNLIDMFGGPASTLIVATAAVVLSWTAYLIPIADGISCARGGPGCSALIPALLASTSIVGLHIAGTFYFRIPFWYGFLFPLGYSAGALIAIDSIRKRLRGRVSWKGRTYP